MSESRTLGGTGIPFPERPGETVLGPSGRPMTANDLPPPDTTRWVIRRKAEVVAGVRAGLISIEEACRRYGLTLDEFQSWQRLLDRHGLKGLRVTRVKDYRASLLQAERTPPAPRPPRRRAPHATPISPESVIDGRDRK